MHFNLRPIIFLLLSLTVAGTYANTSAISNKHNALNRTIILLPTITSFGPANGAIGTLVTINGTNLSSPTAFTIGGQNALVVSNTGAVLVAMVMPGATTGAVSITTAGGAVNGSGNFTVTPTLCPSTQQGTKLVGTNNVGPAHRAFQYLLVLMETLRWLEVHKITTTRALHGFIRAVEVFGRNKVQNS